jgi:hypothetical protein
VGVLALKSVSGWPVWGSGFSAAGGQGLGADWLAIFLLSVSASWEVVLELGKTLGSVWLLASSGVGSVADWEVVWVDWSWSLGESLGSISFLASSRVGSIADWSHLSSLSASWSSLEEGLVLGSVWLLASSGVESVADWSVLWVNNSWGLVKSMGSIWLLASAGVGAIADWCIGRSVSFGERITWSSALLSSNTV